MPDGSIPAIDWADPPASLDQIARELRALRDADGAPSFAEIGRRIAAQRGSRGVPEHERRIPRTTIYRCFQDGRRRIDTDAVIEIALALGLPPGLRQRWAARLRLARAASDGAAVASVRDDVPAPVPYFTGRTAELARVLDVVASNRLAWVSAMAGAGKTQLALRAAQEFPFGALFLDLRGHNAESPPVTPQAAKRAILRRLGAGQSEVDGEDRLLRTLESSGRLLVLDDAANPGQVREILGDSTGIPVIVTSRAPLSNAGDWAHVELGGLGGHETAAMLRTFTAASGNSVPLAGEPENHAEHLADITGGLPLAIALVGGRLATHPEWTLAEHVDLMRRRLATPRVDDELRAELDISYRALPTSAGRLLRALADLPVSEVDIEEAAILTNISPEEATEAHGVLAGASLIIPRGEGQFGLHALVRAYAKEQSEETDSPRTRDAAFHRLGQHFAQRVWTAYETLAAEVNDVPRRTTFEYPSRAWSAAEASAWLQRRLPSLLTSAHAAPERGHPELLFRISEGLSWWMNFAGHNSDALRLHEAAADLAADVGDHDALAMASLDSGQLLVNSQRPEEAQEHFERAQRLIADAGVLSDPGTAGLIENMSAIIDLRQGRLERAAKSLRRAVEIHEERDEPVRLISALINLSVVLHTSGHFTQEREVLERALQGAEACGNTVLRANALVNMAELNRATRDYSRALTDADSGIGLTRELGLVYLEAAGEITAAQTLRDLGELTEASARIAKVLSLAEDLGIGVVNAEALIVHARLSADLGDLDAARASLVEAESYLADGGDFELRGRLHQLRGEVSSEPEDRAREFSQARTAYRRAGSYRAENLFDPAPTTT